MSGLQILDYLLTLLAVGGILLGLAMVWRALGQARLLRQAAASRPSKVAQAAMGPVTLCGSAQPLRPMSDPIYGKPCASCRVTITQGGQTTSLADTSAAYFWLADDTGRVLVDPKGATTHFQETLDVGPGQFPVSHPVEQYVRGIAGIGPEGWRLQAEILRPERLFYAQGLLAPVQKQDLARFLKSDAQRMKALDGDQDGAIDHQEWEAGLARLSAELKGDQDGAAPAIAAVIRRAPEGALLLSDMRAPAPKAAAGPGPGAAVLLLSLGLLTVRLSPSSPIPFGLERAPAAVEAGSVDEASDLLSLAVGPDLLMPSAPVALGPQLEGRQVLVRLFHNGRPIRKLTSVRPDFWASDEKGRVQGARVSRRGYDWLISGLPAGALSLTVGVDSDPSAPGPQAGDLAASVVLEGAPGIQRITVDLLRLMRLTKPQDQGGENLPAMASPVRFTWEPLGRDIRYRWSLDACDAKGVVVKTLLKDLTADHDMELALPPNPPGQHYVFRLTAFQGRKAVAAVAVRGRGVSRWSYALRVAAR